MIRVQISGDALDDLNEGFWFYEAQEPGLGDYFLTQLRADIAQPSTEPTPLTAISSSGLLTPSPWAWIATCR
jgi:hypothetical protein